MTTGDPPWARHGRGRIAATHAGPPLAQPPPPAPAGTDLTGLVAPPLPPSAPLGGRGGPPGWSRPRPEVFGPGLGSGGHVFEEQGSAGVRELGSTGARVGGGGLTPG